MNILFMSICVHSWLNLIMQHVIYGLHKMELGEMVIGITDLGLCWLGFMMSESDGAYKGDGLTRMQKKFKASAFVRDDKKTKLWLDEILKAWGAGGIGSLTLDLQGTEFERAVWHALLFIPRGSVVSYGDIAKTIEKPKAVRAVGTAVGNNPVSLIVPCHRVVRANGALGNYGWGLDLKQKILKSEGAL